MPKKRPVTSGERAAVDPDDAPMLTAAQIEDMEHFRGNTFIKRGPGRPPTGEAKELVSVRLDRDVVAKLRESGPGWQSQVSELLRQALRMRDVAVEGVFDTVAETLQGKGVAFGPAAEKLQGKVQFVHLDDNKGPSFPDAMTAPDAMTGAFTRRRRR
jgi:uncharacterized protein (DUF4415 family)